MELSPAQIMMEHEVADLRKELTSTLGYIRETMENGFRTMTTKQDYTNGKVAEIMAWKYRVEGGATVVKGIWGAVGAYVIAATIGLFYMWIAFQQMEAKFNTLDVTIKNTVRTELGSVVLQETK